jgi:Zn-dependent protease with chaperone function
VILPYFVRLVCLCLAGFFLVHLALALASSSVTPVAMRMAARMDPRSAARLLLGLRLFPGAFASLLVIGLCVPSYLWLEPHSAVEQVRWEIVIAAAFGFAVWALSIGRALRAIRHSRRYAQYCRSIGWRTRVSGETSPVWVLQAPVPVFALAGVVHPRLVLSQAIVDALSAEELAVALRHECAHRISRDNLKRLLILSAPDILPFFRSMRALERGWSKFTEWAADDAAAAGSAHRSLSLAAALVRVARMGGTPQSQLETALLAGGQDLQARIDRLLRPQPPRVKPERMISTFAPVAAGMLALALAALLQPATLHSFHVLIERLIQ